MLALAGMWQSWDRDDAPLLTCAIVTTGANAPISRIHHRMPVIIEQENWPLWLGETGQAAAPLMRAAPDVALGYWRVNPEVNSNRASGEGLIRPLEDSAYG